MNRSVLTSCAERTGKQIRKVHFHLVETQVQTNAEIVIAVRCLHLQSPSVTRFAVGVCPSPAIERCSRCSHILSGVLFMPSGTFIM